MQSGNSHLVPTLLSNKDQSVRGKIVATVGPATEKDLEHTLEYGTIRINLAFTFPENYQERCDFINRVRQNVGNQICIMLDAVGPRVKLGKLPQEGINLENGKTLTITTRRDQQISDSIVTTIFEEFASSVKPGEPILLAEGKYALEIVEITNETDVLCKVTKGGLLKKRGINLPKSNLNCPALSNEDKKVLRYILANDNNNVDMIALSFVRDVSDIDYLKAFLKEINREDVKIQAKIETQQAVDNIEAIAQNCDALMVARGDLWSELADSWSIPRVTKQIIQAGKKAAIPVICATQTLSSMCTNDLPSRAEVDELYFLLTSGTECIMGSEEFTIGEHPAAVIHAIKTIAHQVDLEEKQLLENGQKQRVLNYTGNMDNYQGAVTWAENSKRVECMIVITHFGKAVKQIMKLNPGKPVVVITNNEKTARYLQQFNVYVIFMNFNDTDGALEIAQSGIKALDWRFQEPKTAILCINHQYTSIQEVPL